MYFYKVLKLNIKAGQSCRSGCRTPPPFPPLKVWTRPMASHSSHDTYFRIFQACTQIQSFGSSHPFANRKRGQMLLTSPPPTQNHMEESVVTTFWSLFFSPKCTHARICTAQYLREGSEPRAQGHRNVSPPFPPPPPTLLFDWLGKPKKESCACSFAWNEWILVIPVLSHRRRSRSVRFLICL